MQELVVRAKMMKSMSIPSQLHFCRPASCSWQIKRPISCSWRPHSMITDYQSFLNSFPRPAIQNQAGFRTKSSQQLQERIKQTLSRSEPTAMMELIDTIQRLGIGHYFEAEIKLQLEMLWSMSSESTDDDLFATSLRFRLLRHNGFPTSTDVFKKFVNKNGRFEDLLIKDKKGMLNLYEASYLGTKDEELLLQAMDFTTTHLTHPLELPRHLRMVRLEARNYIHEYTKQRNCNWDVLNLAKLDCDLLQLQHQAELAEIIRWWKELGLVDKLTFARDKPLECFLWTVGMHPEPHQSTCRIQLAKAISILHVLDDIFDAYGSLDELVLLVDAIKRWDVGATEHLPEYMKICYMALHNTINDIAYKVLKEHGWNIVPHLRRTWEDLVEAYMVEAIWFNNGYVPTLEEYLANGVTSGGTYLALVHSFFLVGQGVTKETIALLDPYPNLFRCSGRILRLWDDLGTAKEEQERGDVASSIECYMKEEGMRSEEEARRNIKKLIGELWSELNGEMVAPNGLPPSAISASLNVARTCQVVYHNGDDTKCSSVEDQVQHLFFRPIDFPKGLSNVPTNVFN